MRDTAACALVAAALFLALLPDLRNATSVQTQRYRKQELCIRIRRGARVDSVIECGSACEIYNKNSGGDCELFVYYPQNRRCWMGKNRTCWSSRTTRYDAWVLG